MAKRRWNWGTVLLIMLLMMMPALSYYYLKKGHSETLQVQEKIKPKGLFDPQGIWLNDSLKLSEDSLRGKISLIGYALERSQLDSLDLLLKTFGEERDLIDVFVVQPENMFIDSSNEKTTKSDYPSFYTVLFAANEVWVDKKGSVILIDTEGRLLTEVPLNGLRHYQFLTRAIALKMPKKKRKGFEIKKEKEK